MAKVQVTVPEDLGLTAEQLEALKVGFANQLVEVLRGVQAEESARADPKTKQKSKQKEKQKAEYLEIVPLVRSQ